MSEEAEQRPLVLAAAQTVPIPGDVAANMDQHLGLIRQAALEHAQLVLFPELSITGYELDLARELAFSAEDPRIEPLSDAAARHRMTLLVGAPVRLPSGLHIACFVIRPNRSLDIYTKLFVHESERHVFQPGSLDPRIDLGNTMGAIAICADTKHPEHIRRAVDSGAAVYLAGVFFTPDAYPAHERQLSGYALRHSMLVLLANYGAPSGDLPAAGLSAAWAPGGKRLAQLPAGGSGIVTATLERDVWTGSRLRR